MSVSDISLKQNNVPWSREAISAFAAGAATGGFEGPELDRLTVAFSAGVDLGWNWRAADEASFAEADYQSRHYP